MKVVMVRNEVIPINHGPVRQKCLSVGKRYDLDDRIALPLLWSGSARRPEDPAFIRPTATASAAPPVPQGDVTVRVVKKTDLQDAGRTIELRVGMEVNVPEVVAAGLIQTRHAERVSGEERER